MMAKMIEILTAVSFRLIGHFGQVQLVESRDRDVNLTFSRENYRGLVDVHESKYIPKAWSWSERKKRNVASDASGRYKNKKKRARSPFEAMHEASLVWQNPGRRGQNMYVDR